MPYSWHFSKVWASMHWRFKVENIGRNVQCCYRCES